MVLFADRNATCCRGRSRSEMHCASRTTRCARTAASFATSHCCAISRTVQTRRRRCAPSSANWRWRTPSWHSTSPASGARSMKCKAAGYEVCIEIAAADVAAAATVTTVAATSAAAVAAAAAAAGCYSSCCCSCCCLLLVDDRQKLNTQRQFSVGMNESDWLWFLLIILLRQISLTKEVFKEFLL